MSSKNVRHHARHHVLPQRLYKYLPSQYVDSVVRKGLVLFRNLASYRSLEEQARGDVFEARHVDRPGGGVKLTLMATGKSIEGDFAFVNAVDAQLVFAFCMSLRRDSRLYDEFNCDACVEITSPPLFFRHCRQAMRKKSELAGWTSKHQAVEYYAHNAAPQRNVKNPTELAFFKPEVFLEQYEYRLAIWNPQALKLEQRIVVGDALEKAERERPEQSGEVELRLPGNIRSRQYMHVHLRKK